MQKEVLSRGGIVHYSLAVRNCLGTNRAVARAQTI